MEPAALGRILTGLSRTNGRLERETKALAEKQASQVQERSLMERRRIARVEIRRIAARVGLRVEIFEPETEQPAPGEASRAAPAATKARPKAPAAAASARAAAGDRTESRSLRWQVPALDRLPSRLFRAVPVPGGCG